MQIGGFFMRKKLLWGAALAVTLLALAGGYLFATLSGGFPAAYYTKKGQQYLDRGRDELAEQALKLALKADPDRVDARLTLARLCRRTGREQQAELLLRQGLEQDSRSSVCWLELARLYVSQDRLEQASALLDHPREGYLALTIGQRRPRIALDKPAGRYRAPLRITAAPEEGTVCYYTLDGTVPTLSSPVWPGSLELGEGSHTLTLIAVRADLPSPVLRAGYTVEAAAPAFAPEGELRQLLDWLEALQALLEQNGGSIGPD